MTANDHYRAVMNGDIAPRVVQHSWGYVAWFPNWEGAPRPDYAAAMADLNDTKEYRRDRGW